MKFLFYRSKALKEEITSWVEEKIIEPGQAEKLAEKYDLDREAPWYTQSSFLLSAVALLFAAMGLILIISKNWHKFNIPVRMAMGLLPLFIAWAWGLYAWRRGDEKRTELAFFFASLAFGANIFLQAQIFHIEAYFPNAFLWWALGILPFMVLLQSRAIHIVYLCILLFYLPMQIGNSQFSYLSVLLFSGMIYMLYARPNRTIILLALASLVLFAVNLASFVHGQQNNYEYFTYGAILALLLTLVLDRVEYIESFKTKVEILLLVFLTGCLFALTFDDVLDDLGRNQVALMTYAMVPVVAGLFLLSRKSPELIYGAGVTAFILSMQLVLMALAGDRGIDDGTAFLLSIFTNLCFFFLAAACIYQGLVAKTKKIFMSGIVLVLLLGLGRYIDYFENYMVTGLVFIAASFFIWFMNRYWNKHYEKN